MLIAGAAASLDVDVWLFNELHPARMLDLKARMAQLGWPHSAQTDTHTWRGRGLIVEDTDNGVLGVSRCDVLDVCTVPPADSPGSWLELAVSSAQLTAIGCRVLLRLRRR